MRPNKAITATYLLTMILTINLGCRKTEDTAGTPDVFTTQSGLEMVAISGGSFEMGSTKGGDDESPVHKVWISPFLMDRYEVVQEQFKKFQFPDPSHFKNPKNPLDQINWTDATMYCNERSLAEGLEPCYDEETWDCNFAANGYRLPTEAEWEYACRAGTNSQYSFGSTVQKLTAHAWFDDNICSQRRLPPGRRYRQNARRDNNTVGPRNGCNRRRLVRDGKHERGRRRVPRA